jgi:hypothetical protein
VRSFVFAIVLGCLHVAASNARAQSRVVEVVLAGRASPRLEARLRAVAVRAGVETAIETREHIEPRDVLDGLRTTAFAQVWLDTNGAESALVYVHGVERGRFLARAMRVPDGYGELAIESLVTVVESTLEALLSGDEIGAPTDEAQHEIEAQTGARLEPEPAEAQPVPPAVVAPRQPDPPPAMHKLDLRVGMRYRPTLLGDGALVRHDVQAYFELTRFSNPTLDVVVYAELRYLPTIVGGGASVGLRAQGGAATVGVGLGGSSDVVTWSVLVGGGGEVSAVEPYADAAVGLTARPGFAVVYPLIQASARVSFALTSFLEVDLLLGLDADPSGTHYDLRSGELQVVTWRPWPVRPFGGVGAAFRFDS